MQMNRSIPTWKKLLLAGSTLTLLAGFLNLAWNTNILGPDSLCHNVVSAAQVERTLGGTGRLDGSSTKTPPAAGTVEFRCIVRQTTKLIGQEEGYLRLEASGTTSGFRFSALNQGRAAETSFFSGESTGGVSDYGGWIMLPESCWKATESRSPGGESRVYAVEASAMANKLKHLELARLLVDAANNVSRRAGCASEKMSAPTELQPPTGRQDSDFTKVCGINGFTLPHPRGSGQGKPSEGSHPLPASIWACDLFLTENQPPSASFTMTQDKLLVSALSQKNHRSADNEKFASCNGKTIYFGMNGSAQYRRLAERSNGTELPDEEALFASFVKAAGSTVGCGNITP